MRLDDERHGTNAGYIQGCRRDCCRTAHAKYKRDRRTRTYLAQGPLTVPATGFQRRIQALMYLGYTMEEISRELGHQKSWCSHATRYSTEYVYRTTHDEVDALFRRWCMVLPLDKPIRTRIRNLARNRGYAPPLAWDNIDDPQERPKRGTTRVYRTAVDEAVVLRLLAGEQLACTTAERHEAMRRWRASGRAERELCLIHNWKDNRYGKDAVA